ncbi:MAG: hypothetical protein IIA17_01395 [candidate division Zixibacteria bacterium]|nr:hypothetical protein [candidate division Zixibacteria bacterium]
MNSNADIKIVDTSQIEKSYKKYDHIQLDSQYMLSSDGHKCLSSPELFVEEFFITNNIIHIKEGDINKDSGKRLTEYPFDSDLNSNKRSKEADWIIMLNEESVFVEYFERRMDQKYLDKVDVKRELCDRCGIRLIEMWRKDLTTEKLSVIFGEWI